MFGQSKPLYEIEKKLEYKKHLQRLDEINRERNKRIFQKQTSLKQSKRKRNNSMHFHAKRHDEEVKQQNIKLFNKIMGIARSKSSLIPEDQYPKMLYFQNKERKRLRQEIIENNIILAEKILSKHSQFDASNKRKMTNEYQRIKKRLERNKRATLPQLQEKSFRHIKSEEKINIVDNSATTIQAKTQ